MRKISRIPRSLLFASLLCVMAHAALAGPKNATILIIRHAEKSADTKELTPAGETRAKGYIKYFQDYRIDGAPLKLAAIYATTDSKKSHRTRATVEPLAASLALDANIRFENKDFAGMVTDLEAHHAGESVLVCWHHGKIPELLKSLGVDPSALLPGGEWPAEQYTWLLELRYDADGKLVSSRRVVEDF